MSLQVIFLRSPYANCTNTNQIYKSVLGSIPPAIDLPATGDISSPIETLWDLLKACWKINPMERPSVYDVQEFVADHGPAVVSAFQDRSISISPILK
ncbi:1418_t:CDS:1, partial [Acaulospora colombiana]